MRLGLFLEALARVAEVDLAVLPVAGAANKSTAFLGRLGITPTMLPCDSPDTHFALLSRLEDPQARLQAFLCYGRPRLAAWVSTPVIERLRSLATTRRYDFVHIGRTYLASAAYPWLASDAALSLDLDEDDYQASLSIARLRRRRGDPEAADWSQADAVAFDRLLGEVTPRFDRLWISAQSIGRAYKHVTPRQTRLSFQTRWRERKRAPAATTVRP